MVCIGVDPPLDCWPSYLGQRICIASHRIASHRLTSRRQADKRWLVLARRGWLRPLSQQPGRASTRTVPVALAQVGHVARAPSRSVSSICHDERASWVSGPAAVTGRAGLRHAPLPGASLLAYQTCPPAG
ncbi:hypothetical protein A4R35_23095 [Thermogemmatispora tikiterensis]|uniref:Uncharacterized protein n=1 Tax=Thermogemmatispora tikiterensis TaxID=1825093 RepID=A0A328VLZ5_9CHLR|nr:hypothetical protein A4R35_23095 [Thermogemmatispora tikiterensis]